MPAVLTRRAAASRTCRLAAAVALTVPGLLVAGAAPAPAAEARPTVYARTSTCPTEVGPRQPGPCDLAIWTVTAPRGPVSLELQRVVHNPDPADLDGLTYLRDVVCSAPARVRVGGSIRLYADIDVASRCVGAPAWARHYRLTGQAVDGAVVASAVNGRPFRHTLYSTVLP